MRKAIPMFAATVSAAFLAFATLVLFVGTGARAADAASTTYDLTPLGTLGGATTIARGVNTSGKVVGQSQGPSGTRAVLWDGGTAPQDLGTLGGPASMGRGINDDNLAVGFSRISSTNNQQRAFVAKSDPQVGTHMESLGTLPDYSSSEASAINDSEPVQIVGRMYSSSSSGRAFLYESGEMKPLGTLGGQGYSEAWAINDKGEVVGESGSDDEHGMAFLYSEGVMNPLGKLDGQDYSEAMGINDSGQIVGWSYTSRALVQGRAFLYENGEMKDLGALPGDPYSMARAIDEHGRAVGQSRSAGGTNRAFLWENGQMMDLNSLISPDDPDNPKDPASTLSRLLDAYAISDSGKIVGSALAKDGQTRAFLLTPDDSAAPETAAEVSPAPNAAGWINENVTVTLRAKDEGGSNVKGITLSASGAQPIDERAENGSSTQLSIEAEGETTITYWAVDHAGNAAEPNTLTVRLDKTEPEINIVTPADGADYNLGEALAAGYACTDGGSGPASCAGPVPDGGDVGTGAVGQKTFTVEARDAAGNVASKSHDYRVVYDFAGFFSPVDNPTVLNRAQAGSAIPVKFDLSGDRGLNIFAENSPRSRRIGCDSAAPVDAIEQTASAGESGLTYDADAARYVYVWKTRKAWGDTCRRLAVELDDGTVHRANFKLR